MIKKILLIILLIPTIILAKEVSNDRQVYLNSIYKKIYSELHLWEAKKDSSCEVTITQDREGNILSSTIDKCTTTDEYFIKQLKKAIKNSSPLPKASNALFSEKIIINPVIKRDINVMKFIIKKAVQGDEKAVKALDALLGKGVFKKAFDSQTIEMRINK